MMTYDDLRYFQAIAESGSLRRAAQALKVSQPSLSYMVKKLEDRLQAPLLQRHQKGVVLTPQGKIFADKVGNIMEQWQQLDSSMTSTTDRLRWQITIGTHHSVARYTLPKFLPSLLQRFPEAQIRLTHGLSRSVNQLVIDGSIDVGLVINPVSQPDLIFKEIVTDTVGIWMQPGLSNRDVVIYDPSLAQTQWILRQLERKQMVFRRHLESDSLEVIASLTEAGCGVGILPSRVVDTAKVERFMPQIAFNDLLCAVFKGEFRQKYLARPLLDALQDGEG